MVLRRMLASGVVAGVMAYATVFAVAETASLFEPSSGQSHHHRLAVASEAAPSVDLAGQIDAGILESLLLPPIVG